MVVFVVTTHWLLFLPDNFVTPYIFTRNWHFIVSFFFMLSGFLFARGTFTKEENHCPFKDSLLKLFHNKRSYILKYEIMIVLAMLYNIFIFFLLGKGSLSEILTSGIFDFFCLSTLLNIGSVNMNSGWFFQCLVQFWFLSPFIVRCFWYFKKKFAHNKSLSIFFIVLFQIFYLIIVKQVRHFANPYYNSFVRILEITVGMTLYELAEYIPLRSTRLVTILECIGIIVFFSPLFKNVYYNELLNSVMVHSIMSGFILYVYAHNNGLISAKVFRKNPLIDLVSRYSFDIFIFHFITFHIMTLSPVLSSPYLLLAEGFMIPIGLGMIINQIQHKYETKHIAQ